MRDPLTLFSYALGLTALALAVLGALWWWQSRRIDAAERERRRRLHVNRIGRLAEGRIVDLREEETTATGSERLLVYDYWVRGVEYQAAQDITFCRDPLSLRRLAAGQATQVKYDPRNPPNSIVLCEEWSGL